MKALVKAQPGPGNLELRDVPVPRIGGSDLKVFLIKNPSFAAKMVSILCQRLAKTDEILIGKISELNRIKITRDV